eukprot:maker-scaffold301_size216225-snap-gene-0.18 protein:Tk06225 transcript:maker-scaffold301_size216225-snap-gene-0.18-mRNA-1 annotation:"polyphosphoinositide phosphatase isoform x2"
MSATGAIPKRRPAPPVEAPSIFDPSSGPRPSSSRARDPPARRLTEKPKMSLFGRKEKSRSRSRTPHRPSRPVSTAELEDAEEVTVEDLLDEPDSPRSGPESPISRESHTKFHAFVKTVQRIVIYETRSRYYVVGSNNTETQFRVLNIHRNEPRDLVVTDDNIVYDTKDIKSLLVMADVGNRSKVGQKVGYGLTKTISAFGIAGFVRFLEGYYILLITKRRKAAMIGHHCVYKIEDTALIYIPNDDVRESHPDEARHKRMFQAVDMSSNFYYSYSYDLTHTLQFNMAPPKFLRTKSKARPIGAMFPDGQAPANLGYVGKPNTRYLWNTHFLNQAQINQNWVLHIIHGFVDQSNISVYGRPVLLTLIARRSSKYAGTRFLKRGATFEGDVANEVETEQIVSDSTILDLQKAKITSYVQIRGSVPSHWAQDVTKMVPKPQIFFELSDPHGRTSGQHFDQLMRHYGSPVVVVNLVKRREKRRRHECLLGEEFQKQVEYLNMFLRPEHRIKYFHLDMARCKNRQDTEVIQSLDDIANYSIRRTGIFYNNKQSFGHVLYEKKRHDSLVEKYVEKLADQSSNPDQLLQAGIVRTNCVDCLDRTNTAQFVVGKCALGLQLFALGFVESPHLEFDSDCARMLEVMYEDHGDTLALQYGGSQLIHRIKSYRKESKWTSKATDIAQTLRRYYSNTLSDAEKQNAINLFLGVYVPEDGKVPIWDKDFLTDKYLHIPQLLRPYQFGSLLFHASTQWFSKRLVTSLPFPLESERKECVLLKKFDPVKEEFDLYHDYYRPFELSVLSELFPFKEVSHSVRDYMPNCCTDYSPFVVRMREVKRREETIVRTKNSFTEFFFGKKSDPLIKNPSVTGATSGASLLSNASDSDDDLSSSQDLEELHEEIGEEAAETTAEQAASFKSVLGVMDEGVVKADIKEPCEEAMHVYSRYAIVEPSNQECVILPIEVNSLAEYEAKLRQDYKTVVEREPISTECYRNFCQIAQFGAKQPNADSLELYSMLVQG